MKNVTAYIGHIDRDLGALRRNPTRFLAERLAPQLKKLKEKPEGLVFGHMETDEKRHWVVCVDGVPLQWPVDLDDVSGRHTGFNQRGPNKGKPKGVGPNPTELEDDVAENLLRDVLARNRKQVDLLPMGERRWYRISPFPPNAPARRPRNPRIRTRPNDPL